MDGDRISKRYYWLKLNENFFEREEIKIIEDMPNGKDYIIFYMKLLLKSVGTEGVLKFRGIIPYTPEMLSSITNTDIDTVRVATDMFTKLELMEKWDDGTLFMAETQNMIGSETGWAKKKRLQREKEIGKGDIVPELSTNCPIEIDIDNEIDKEEYIDSTTITTTDKDLIIKEWNDLGIQQLRGIKSNTNRHNSLKARVKEYSIGEIVEAIRLIDKSDFLKGENDRKWVITFDWLMNKNNFIKVIEGNYTRKEISNANTRGQDKREGGKASYDYDKFFD